MKSPFSSPNLIVLILVFAFVLAFIQVGILTIAFEKLGLSAGSAISLLFASLFGSAINLPLFKISAEAPPEGTPPSPLRSILKLPEIPFTGTTMIAINAGGCLIPVMFSFYLLKHSALGLGDVILAIGIVSTLSYMVSRPIHGLGIGMPMFVAPITAALVAIVLNPEQSAPLAYICGTMGVLIGADLFRLKDIRRIGVPIAAIGGAGTFDGIFITGIVAVLLA
jgi:uncharacterized membrane protein